MKFEQDDYSYPVTPKINLFPKDELDNLIKILQGLKAVGRHFKQESEVQDA